MPLRHWGNPVQFPVQSKGEWLAILRLRVVSTTPLKRPDCFAPDCVRAAQSKSEKLSPQDGLVKRRMAADFQRFVPGRSLRSIFSISSRSVSGLHLDYILAMVRGVMTIYGCFHSISARSSSMISCSLSARRCFTASRFW
jgi:hypothetical protein